MQIVRIPKTYMAMFVRSRHTGDMNDKLKSNGLLISLLYLAQTSSQKSPQTVCIPPLCILMCYLLNATTTTFLSYMVKICESVFTHWCGRANTAMFTFRFVSPSLGFEIQIFRWMCIVVVLKIKSAVHDKKQQHVVCMYYEYSPASWGLKLPRKYRT